MASDCLHIDHVAQDRPFVTERPSWHSEMELHLILQGNCEFFIRGEKYSCRKNSVVLVHKNEVHAYHPDGESTVKTTNFLFPTNLVCDRTIARNALQRLSSVHHLILSDEEITMAKLLLDHIFEECAHKKLNWKRVTGNHIESLLVILYRVADRHVLTSDGSKSIVQEIIKYLDEKYMERPSLGKVSDRFGFSPFTLSKKFKQYAGLGFKEYLIHRSIVEAQRLLEETDRKVATIAYDVGFGSLSSFNDDFRKLTGITPSAYRKIASETSAWGQSGATPL